MHGFGFSVGSNSLVEVVFSFDGIDLSVVGEKSLLEHIKHHAPKPLPKTAATVIAMQVGL